MNKEQSGELSQTESEVWNAIGQFEKILEVMPNDRFSLETLADAYDKIGDHTRAEDYLVRLANVLADENDEDSAQVILEKLRQISKPNQAVQDAIARLDSLSSKKVMAEIIDDGETLASRQGHIAAEISFAWNLLQAKKLSQEDYSMIVHDLSETSGSAGDMPVSTLHALHDRNFSGVNDIMAFASTNCNTPMICLGNFELQKETVTLLSLEFIINRCAIVFEIIGNDALVALLNPYDEQLKMDVSGLIGRDCHFFIVASEDFDSAVGKIKAMLQPEEGKPK